jgi:hypothetical protein
MMKQHRGKPGRGRQWGRRRAPTETEKRAARRLMFPPIKPIKPPQGAR